MKHAWQTAKRHCRILTFWNFWRDETIHSLFVNKGPRQPQFFCVLLSKKCRAWFWRAGGSEKGRQPVLKFYWSCPWEASLGLGYSTASSAVAVIGGGFFFFRILSFSYIESFEEGSKETVSNGHGGVENNSNIFISLLLLLSKRMKIKKWNEKQFFFFGDPDFPIRKYSCRALLEKKSTRRRRILHTNSNGEQSGERRAPGVPESARRWKKMSFFRLVRLKFGPFWRAGRKKVAAGEAPKFASHDLQAFRLFHFREARLRRKL